MDATPGKEILLALCTGFAVEADDGLVGVVETPLFPPDGVEPDYLVLRIGHVYPRRPIVSTLLVEWVDPHARIVRVHGSRDDIERLPEHLPLAV